MLYFSTISNMKLRKFFRRIGKVFEEIDSNNPLNHRKSSCKNFQSNTIVDFSKAFDSIHREKMEKILLVYGLPKETFTAIMTLYTNTWYRHRLLQHRCRSFVWRYISTISVSNQRTLNADRSNKRKWLYTKEKEKKQTIFCRNYNRRR